MPKVTNNSKNKFTEKAVKILIGSAVGCITLAVLFLASSALILSKDLKGTLITALSILCCCISALLCGFTSGKLNKISGLLYGLLSVIPVCMLLTILTLYFGGTLGSNFSFAVPAMLISSAIGGVLAVNIKRKPRY